MFSLEPPHRSSSNEYTQYTILNIKKENHPKLSQICSSEMFPRVRNSRGKRVISVGATEDLLYICNRVDCCSGNHRFA